jgi:hypothetical protein
MKTLLTSLALILLLTGCATGPKYSPLPISEASGQVELIVFRQSRWKASGGCHSIKVDGKRIGKLSNGSYLQALVEPGIHKVALKTGDGQMLVFEFNTNDSKRVFVELAHYNHLFSDYPKKTIKESEYLSGNTLGLIPEKYAVSKVKELNKAIDPICISS